MPLKTYEDFLREAPGLMGKIARYINGNLDNEQSAICIAASLSFMAALYSKRIIGPNGITPCIFTCAIAEAGVGKTTAQHILRSIIEKAVTDLPDDRLTFLLGVPKSDAVLDERLAAQTRRFLIWDEIGIALGAYSKSRSSHEALILGALMEIFSSSGKVTMSKDAITRPTKPIKGAHLSIFAASTPTRFYNALNINFITDGLLPRILLFFQNEGAKWKTVNDDVLALSEICTSVRAICEWIPLNERANPDGILTEEKKLLPVIFEDSGAFSDLIEEAHLYVDAAPTESARVFWRRYREQALKIAINLSSLSVNDVFVSKQSFQYARELARFIIKNAIAQCEENLYDNPLQRDTTQRLTKLQRIMGIGESITGKELARRCRWIRSKERKELIEDLVESEVWSHLETPTQTKSIHNYKRIK